MYANFAHAVHDNSIRIVERENDNQAHCFSFGPHENSCIRTEIGKVASLSGLGHIDKRLLSSVAANEKKSCISLLVSRGIQLLTEHAS